MSNQGPTLKPPPLAAPRPVPRRKTASHDDPEGVRAAEALEERMTARLRASHDDLKEAITAAQADPPSSPSVAPCPPTPSKSLAPEDKVALAVGRPIVGYLKKNWLVAALIAVGGGNAIRTGNAPEKAEIAIQRQNLREKEDEERRQKLDKAVERINKLEDRTACYQRLFAAHFEDTLPKPGAMVWSPNIAPAPWLDSCKDPTGNR